MKILYFTDVHGDKRKIIAIKDIAKEHNIDLIIDGGDSLPKNDPTHFVQKKYLKWLKKEINKLSIDYCLMLGNDDLIIFDQDLIELDKKLKNFHYIAQNKITINDVVIIGCNWVKDYPFRLKDRCLLDNRKSELDMQFGLPMFVTKDSFDIKSNWENIVKKRPRLNEKLDSLPQPSKKDKKKKVIYVVHMPPNQLSLDVCQNMAAVGSQSVYDFIDKMKPWISLHGHIHESPNLTNIWKNKINETIVIQPGQEYNNLIYVLIDTDTGDITRDIKDLCQ